MKFQFLSVSASVFCIILHHPVIKPELMRLAIGRISDGELEFAQKICSFVREIYRELTLVSPNMDDSSDMKSKMDTMLQSVMKIENACLSVHVRGSEYGSENTSFCLLGVPENE
ncbi:hypothetical protein ACS0TY_001596 [Phlomoides rotata]